MRTSMHQIVGRAWRAAAVLAACVLAFTGGAGKAGASRPQQPPRRLRVLLVVFDGLRPDHVTLARTPRLYALATKGVMSWQHHSLFPTVTRVNASALATGTGPAGHGILDNSIYLPTVADRVLNTGEARDMMLADSVLQGQLLTAPTIGRHLRQAGLRLMVASAGSSGSAYLFAGGAGTPVINAELIEPAALTPLVTRVLGTPPADASPNLGRNAWAVQALLRVGVDSLNVDVGYVWLSDPDHTAHGAGLGSAMADSSIRAADREFGRLLDGLSARGLGQVVNVMVVSDHGFSTHGGDTRSLAKQLGGLADSVVIAGSAIHVRRGGATTRDTALYPAPLPPHESGGCMPGPPMCCSPPIGHTKRTGRGIGGTRGSPGSPVMAPQARTMSRRPSWPAARRSVLVCRHQRPAATPTLCPPFCICWGVPPRPPA